MVVYGDLVFLLNLLVNFLLLRGTARLGATAAPPLRLWIAAGLGALYAVAVYLPGLYWLRMISIKILTAGLMLLCAFGLKPSTLRLAAVFAVLSLVLCGTVYAVQAVGKQPISYGPHLLYPVSFASLLLTALGVSLACKLLLPTLDHGNNSVLPLTLELQGKKLRLTALRDSGNTLKDPLSGEPVITVYWKALASLLPPSVTSHTLRSPTALLPLLKELSPRLIPYRAVGIHRGLLLAIPCKITVEKETRRALVALSPTPLSDGGAYDALTGGISHA